MITAIKYRVFGKEQREACDLTAFKDIIKNVFATYISTAKVIIYPKYYLVLFKEPVGRWKLGRIGRELCKYAELSKYCSYKTGSPRLMAQFSKMEFTEEELNAFFSYFGENEET